MTDQRKMSDAEADAAFAAAMSGAPAAPMTEQQLQAAIVAKAEGLGLRVYWVPAGARTGIGRRANAKTARGFPDLLIAGERGVIYRECKSEYGDTRPDQDAWGWLLDRAGQNWAVWRPADWASGRVEAELRALTA